MDDQDEWKEVFDHKTGRSYYYNRRTRARTWTQPEHFIPASHARTPEQQTVTAKAYIEASGGAIKETELPDWVAGQDKDTGQTYYYNVKTREVSWFLPADAKLQSSEAPVDIPPASAAPSSASAPSASADTPAVPASVPAADPKPIEVKEVSPPAPTPDHDDDEDEDVVPPLNRDETYIPGPPPAALRQPTEVPGPPAMSRPETVLPPPPLDRPESVIPGPPAALPRAPTEIPGPPPEPEEVPMPPPPNDADSAAVADVDPVLIGLTAAALSARDKDAAPMRQVSLSTATVQFPTSSSSQLDKPSGHQKARSMMMPKHSSDSKDTAPQPKPNTTKTRRKLHHTPSGLALKPSSKALKLLGAEAAVEIVDDTAWWVREYGSSTVDDDAAPVAIYSAKAQKELDRDMRGLKGLVAQVANAALRQQILEKLNSVEKVLSSRGLTKPPFVINKAAELQRAKKPKKTMARAKPGVSQRATGPARDTVAHRLAHPLGTDSHPVTLLSVAWRTWHFRHPRVLHYRYTASQVDRSGMPRHMAAHPTPTHRSSDPLPPQMTSVCTVHVPTPSGDMKSRIAIKQGETGESLVRKVWRWCTNRKVPVEQPEAYVLKVRGFDEYILPATLVVEDEYVRKQLRNDKTPDLVLVSRPEETDEFKAHSADADKYLQRVSNAAPHLGDLAPVPEEKLPDAPAVKNLIDVANTFRVRVSALQQASELNLPELGAKVAHVWVDVVLFHGCVVLNTGPSRTHVVPRKSSAWKQWVHPTYRMKEDEHSTVEQFIEIPLKKLPRETRIAFLVYGGESVTQGKLLGWVVQQVINEAGRLVSGEQKLPLWPAVRQTQAHKNTDKKEDEEDADSLAFLFRATNIPNFTKPVIANSDADQGVTAGRLAASPAVLVVQFDDIGCIVTAPLEAPFRNVEVTVSGGLEYADRKRVEWLVNVDPLYELTPADKNLLWRAKQELVKWPRALPKLLLSVDWTSAYEAQQAYTLMEQWTLPADQTDMQDLPVIALELLSYRFADFRVRNFAVSRLLDRVTDGSLRLYLLQLAQCLRFEAYHESPLSRFLLRRALNNPYQIGHFLFWHLRSAMHEPEYCERYTLLLEEYLAFCGPHAQELRKQHFAVAHLQTVAEMVVQLKAKQPKADHHALFREELDRLNFQFFERIGSFQLPLDPRLRATTLITEKCRYMSSKKVPLWLVFRNADASAEPISVIFKAGDDLRQDILTLQILQVMDLMWVSRGLDLRMKPYRVVATGATKEGEGVGMLEVVKNAWTKGQIQREKGGRSGAFQLDVIHKYLQEFNNTDQSLGKAVDNFIRSCAGYSVGTFVLGLADRHSDNIMVTKKGHLFHIDFGHFLGNFKTKTIAGVKVKREREAFVFTEAMAYVMGGRKFRENQLFRDFQQHCIDAFFILRRNAHVPITLFLLMVGAGMPELTRESSIGYLKEMLCLQMTDPEAENHFRSEIERSLNTTTRLIDDFLHDNKHYSA